MAGEAEEAGEAGKARETGKAGEAGKAWETGNAGEAGKAEAAGETGESGKAEAAGETGETGKAEEAGETGKTGEAGKAGEDEKARETGKAGETGLVPMPPRVELGPSGGQEAPGDSLAAALAGTPEASSLPGDPGPGGTTIALSGPVIGGTRLSSPFTLAPMAGVADRPYRRLCVAEGAAMTTSELASAAALARKGRHTREMVRPDPFQTGKAPFCVQLFGKVPQEFADSARFCASELGADMIDLNFACPSRKVVRSGHGAALLKDPDMCLRIAEAAVGAAGVPVTVKTRPGFAPGDRDDPLVFELAPRLADLGIRAVTLHPRWATQAFGGRAEWWMVKRLAASLPVPVIGSGDIDSPELALRRLRESGAAAVMLGRATRGRPWLFAECLALWRGEPPPETGREKIFETACLHARLLEEERGRRAVFVLRSVLSWYIRELRHAAAYRRRICASEKIDEQIEILREALLGGGEDTQPEEGGLLRNGDPGPSGDPEPQDSA
jgi:nifR3 family TIM-barrel protein